MSAPIVLALRLLLALALYAFLGWTLVTLWRETRNQAEALSTRRAPRISLSVRSGRGVPFIRHFIQPEITLGRDPACDIPISDDTVSALHARLKYHHGQWWLEDLASMNGTRLNRQALTTPTVLTTGDEISCGKARVTVDILTDVSISSTMQLKEQQ